MMLPPPITSRTNARVKALRAALSGKALQPGELIGIEGENLIAEAAAANVVIDTVFVREGSEALLQRASLRGLHAEQWCVLSGDVFDAALDTVSPQGIAATVPIPALDATGFFRGGGVLLVLDGVQDPGNVGTLIRSAAAFGTKAIFVTPATANVWSPKVVRSSAGAVFHVPVERAQLAEIAAKLKQHQITLWAAVAQAGGAVAAMEVDLRGQCAVMIGNEGAGLSSEALALADGRISIPCSIESFNAAIAGSILLYEGYRQNPGFKVNPDLASKVQ